MVEYVVSRFFSSCLVSLSQTHTKHNTRVTSPLCANSFSELCCSFLLCRTHKVSIHTPRSVAVFFIYFPLRLTKWFQTLDSWYYIHKRLLHTWTKPQQQTTTMWKKNKKLRQNKRHYAGLYLLLLQENTKHYHIYYLILIWNWRTTTTTRIQVFFFRSGRIFYRFLYK